MISTESPPRQRDPRRRPLRKSTSNLALLIGFTGNHDNRPRSGEPGKEPAISCPAGLRMAICMVNGRAIAARDGGPGLDRDGSRRPTDQTSSEECMLQDTRCDQLSV